MVNGYNSSYQMMLPDFGRDDLQPQVAFLNLLAVSSQRSLRHYTTRVRQQFLKPPDSNTTASVKPKAAHYYMEKV